MSFVANGLKDLERSFRKAASRMASAEATAVRKTGTTIVARQSRAIASIVNLRIGTIKKKIVAIKKPRAGDPRIAFEVRGEGIALREFGAQKTRKGVSVLVLKGGGRRIVKGAFLANGYGGNLQVFKRTGEARRVMKAGRHMGKRREPIEKLYGPDVFSQYVKAEVQAAGEGAWRERLPIELKAATDYALDYIGL